MKRFILLLLIASSCSIEPQDIEYGKDLCHFCSMTIVDNQHASKMVTSKGRTYKYDAIECMINDVNRQDGQDISLLLVSDYGKPGEMIEAPQSTFLVSKSIPSPMGAFLSAFPTEDQANNSLSEKEDKIYTWEEINLEIAP